MSTSAQIEYHQSTSSYQIALQYATEKHQGQTRKFNGEPYVNHPIRVASHVQKAGGSAEQIIAALLHDTIEDTNATKEEITELFGSTVADLVLEVTNDEAKLKEVGKTAYLCDKVKGISNDALLIKLADRLDNIGDLPFNAWGDNYAHQTVQVMEAVKTRELTIGQDYLVHLIEIVVEDFTLKSACHHASL